MLTIFILFMSSVFASQSGCHLLKGQVIAIPDQNVDAGGVELTITEFACKDICFDVTELSLQVHKFNQRSLLKKSTFQFCGPHFQVHMEDSICRDKLSHARFFKEYTCWKSFAFWVPTAA